MGGLVPWESTRVKLPSQWDRGGDRSPTGVQGLKSSPEQMRPKLVVKKEREVGRRRARQGVQEREQGVKGLQVLGSHPGAAGGLGGTVPSGCVCTQEPSGCARLA